MDDRLPERFRTKIVATMSGCWEWTASRSPKGYGQFKLGRRHLAHRVAYELMVGPIPEGLVIDHLCRNRRCVNPTHLEPVTSRENVRRGLGAHKTHCPQGHPYDEANTYFRPVGSRECRICRQAKPHRKRDDAPQL